MMPNQWLPQQPPGGSHCGSMNVKLNIFIIQAITMNECSTPILMIKFRFSILYTAEYSNMFSVKPLNVLSMN